MPEAWPAVSEAQDRLAALDDGAEINYIKDMEIPLSEDIRRYIETQLAAGRYRTPAELIADLVRQQKDQEASECRLWERQRRALRGLLHELADLHATADDGFTNRDHDRILYGGEA